MDVEIHVSMMRGNAILKLTGQADVTVPFSTPGNETFQAIREVSFLANPAGGSPFVAGTDVEYLRVGSPRSTRTRER